MKDKIFTFDPVIYPVKLWISLTDDESLLNKRFQYIEHQQPIQLEDGCYAITSGMLADKKKEQAGVLIVFTEPGLFTKIIAHESYHAARAIFEYLNEPSPCEEGMAYLIGWIADCCEKVKDELTLFNISERKKLDE